MTTLSHVVSARTRIYASVSPRVASALSAAQEVALNAGYQPDAPSPRAQGGETEARGFVKRLGEDFEQFRNKHDGEVANLADEIRALQNAQADASIAGKLGAPPEMSGMGSDPAYSRTFASFFRSGHGEEAVKAANGTGERAKVLAALSVGDNPGGGYLAPAEWDRKISKAQTAKSPMRRLATVQPTSVGAYSTLWSTSAPGSGWVGESAARPATTTPQLAPINFASGEIYANPAATQRLLDDAAVNVEDWLASEVEEEFNRQEGIAFISGNGSNKPFGLLQYVPGGAAETAHPGGTLDVVDTAAAGAIAPDDLVTFAYGLAAPYRQNATWLMSSQTGGVLAKLKDGQGNYIWRESFVVGQPATLLGRPVEFDENMPNVAAGSLSIAFGDFRAGYLINDRAGIRVLRDPFTNKPYVHFYTTKRVGAGVRDPRAIRLLRLKAA